MADKETLRIGFIGAGKIALQRHLPGLAEIPEAQVVAVCNRSHESGQIIAEQHNIPEIMTDWRELVHRDDLHAVFIGTWPYTHMEMSKAALDTGKHVFCQARMARDLDEAKVMVACAEAHPDQVAMICPPPHRMPYEPFIRDLVRGGRLGTITAIDLIVQSSGNLQTEGVSWREDTFLSGKQIGAMGIWAETLNAWFGPYERLSAEYETPIRTKRGPDGNPVEIRIPQVVKILGRLANGVLVSETHSGLVVDKSTPGNLLTVHGLKGTLRLHGIGAVPEFAPPGGEFELCQVPDALKRDWQVEKDFIDAVHRARRGETWCVSPDFHEGLKYMRKVEAVHLAAQTGEAVYPAEL